jgi:GNAT superfamily N-acetyltransferase
MNIYMREAREEEAETLSDISLRSKGYWGYPHEMLEAWRPDLTLTRDYIRRNPVRCVLLEDRLVGFYALKTGDEHYLDHLWLVPEAIGQGIGRLAFEHAVRLAHELGMQSFVIISDVHAEGFYLKMNARKIGEFFSPQQNRMLPKMLFRISNEPAETAPT